MTYLQIQPQFALRGKWEELARQEGLYYEPLELSMPPAPGDHTTCDNRCQWHQERFQWYRDCGRVRSLHGAFMDVNPVSADPQIREISRRRCRESCELAVELGAARVVFHSSALPFVRGGYLDSWADGCARFYTELAEDYDLTICVENSQDIDAEPLRKILERATDPRVCACLDIGHVNYSQASMEEWFHQLGGRIGYLHLSDNRGVFDDHLPLGEGTIDWDQVDRLWRELGKAIPLTLEVGDIAGAKQSVAYLKNHGYFGVRER